MVNLTSSEFRQLLAAIDLQAPFGRRDYCLLVFAYHTGLRVSELSALNIADVSIHGQPRAALHLGAENTKYDKSRLVPLNAVAQKAVARLLSFNQARGFSTAPQAPLFVTRHHRRLSVRTIQWLLETLRTRAGLDVRATPHTLRHSFASDIVSRTGDLRAAQALLGHEWTRTTEVYLHARRDALVAATNSLARPAS